MNMTTSPAHAIQLILNSTPRNDSERSRVGGQLQAIIGEAITDMKVLSLKGLLSLHTMELVFRRKIRRLECVISV
jgi:hypothetical protein